MSRNNFYRNLKDKGYGKKTIHGNEYIVGLKFKEREEEFIKEYQRENYLLSKKPNRVGKWNNIFKSLYVRSIYVYVINYMNYFYWSPFPPIRQSKL